MRFPNDFRYLSFALATTIFAVPLLAVAPSDQEVETAYQQYRAAVCGNECPPRERDVQARIRLLQEYCSSGGTGVDCRPVANWEPLPALFYDHETNTWRVPGALAGRAEFDINGTPTIDLAGGESLVVVVENTNPLLYTATPGKFELKPIDQFSDLQTLAGLLGGNATALLQVEAGKKELQRTAVGTADAESEHAVRALEAAADAFVASQKLADCVTLRTQAASNFVQAVESGRDGSYPAVLAQCQPLPSSAASVHALLETLAQASDTISRRCLELPQEIAKLIDVKPADLVAAREAIERYESIARMPGCAAWHTPIDGRPTSVAVDLERLIVSPVRDELKKSQPNLAPLYADFEANEKGPVDRLVVATKVAKSIEEPLAKLKASLPVVGKSAEQLELFRERLIRNVAGKVDPCPTGAAPPPCVPVASVATSIVVPGGPSRVTKWEFVHSRTVKIAADTPFAEVVPRRQNVDASYSVRSPLASIFDIGLSVTETDIDSPTFGAVREDLTNFTDSNLIVGVVDRESQSGKLALMLNVLPLRLFDVPKLVEPLGVQIGASADTTKPALYWGLSYGLGKYIRLGWGQTAQRVTTLRDETPLGSRIASKDEIRTHRDYEKGQYWSLMVSIRALRLVTE